MTFSALRLSLLFVTRSIGFHHILGACAVRSVYAVALELTNEPFGAFSFISFCIRWRLRSIRTLLAVGKISFDAIATERPFLPVPLLVFNHFCLASVR